MAAPIAFLTLEDGETFLGETLLGALASSRTGARDLGEAVRKQLLDASRSKTWTGFMKGTHVVDVEKDERGIRLYAAKSATRRPLLPAGAPSAVHSTGASAVELGWLVKTSFRSLQQRRRTGRETAA